VELKVLCEPFRVRFTNVTAISQVGINFARKTTTPAHAALSGKV
jgi:hypothetical protein